MTLTFYWSFFITNIVNKHMLLGNIGTGLENDILQKSYYKLNYWLFKVYRLMSWSKIGNVTRGLWVVNSPLGIRGGIFIVPHLLWHKYLAFSGLVWRTIPFSHLLRQPPPPYWGPIYYMCPYVHGTRMIGLESLMTLKCAADPTYACVLLNA